MFVGTLEDTQPFISVVWPTEYIFVSIADTYVEKISGYIHAVRKPDPGEPSSLENLEQTKILPGKVYQTEIFPEQTEILTKQTEIMEDQDA